MSAYALWGAVLIVGSLAWVAIACTVVAIVAVDGRERRYDFYADEEPIPYTPLDPDAPIWSELKARMFAEDVLADIARLPGGDWRADA